MPKPIYNPGHIFTAAEMNQHLVNDDGAELQMFKTEIGHEIHVNVTALPGIVTALETNLPVLVQRVNKWHQILTKMEARING